MDLQVHSVHFDADKKLIAFINDKVGKLKTFSDRIILGEVFPGKELFAKKQCKSFEEATDLACEALRKQVTKHKQKSK